MQYAGAERHASRLSAICEALPRWRDVGSVVAPEVSSLGRLWLLAVYFGLALYLAANSVLLLATGAEPSWFWWVALLPLAISHAVSGFLAIRHSTNKQPAALIE